MERTGCPRNRRKLGIKIEQGNGKRTHDGGFNGKKITRNKSANCDFEKESNRFKHWHSILYKMYSIRWLGDSKLPPNHWIGVYI